MLIDLVACWRFGNLRTMPFTRALQELLFDSGEGMMNALLVYGGLSNVGVYCPVVSLQKNHILVMKWGDDPYLTVHFRQNTQMIWYQFQDEEGYVNIKETETLIESWGEELNRGSTKISRRQ